MAEMLDRQEQGYFEYLVGYITNQNTRYTYSKLLRYLYDKTFIWTIHLDKNRAADGLSIRARYFDDDILRKPCSILEMMIGLADRMENHILWDPTKGDRTSQWFWTMISSMGLSKYRDDAYDEMAVDDIVTGMLMRDYDEYGHGALFTVNDPPEDMRTTEIWYQMYWWCNEKTDEEEKR